jgi:hypothetical protein
MHKAIGAQINYSGNKLNLCQRTFTEQLEINQVINKFHNFMDLKISSPKVAS